MGIQFTNGMSIIPNTNSGGGGGSGVGEWYFYSDEGNINTGPPSADGNAIFTISGTPIVETFDPNKTSGTSFLFFNLKDSSGVDYTTQFNDLQANGGTISITQNGNKATYRSTVPGTYFIDPAGFFAIATTPATQTATSGVKFTFADPITLTFGS